MSSLKYRADVDGLRGVAVLAVLAFHYSSGRLPGGFVGVDVFFVVSGFLITSIILRPGFSFSAFYARRVRRLFPAVAVLLVGVLAFGWFALPPGNYEQLGKHTAAGAGFVSNLILWGESGYFGSDEKPLLHLWSLGIEEQFYLAWPLLLRLSRLWPRGPLALCMCVSVISFAASVVLSTTDLAAAYFSPLSRFWELSLGGVLAVLGPTVLPERLRGLSSGAGIFLILSSAFIITGSDPFPGWRGLLPVGGTWLMIAAGPGALFNRSLLSTRPLVWMGLISYPLYLWHWPALAFARIMVGDYPSRTLRAALVLASFVAAWLTYRLVERPARAGGRKTVYLLCGSVALVGIAGYFVFRAQGVPSREGEKGAYQAYFTNNPPEIRFATRHGLLDAYRIGCDFYDSRQVNVRDEIDASCYTPATRDAVFIWGDSHAAQLNYGLSRTLPPETSLLQVATSGCPPSLTPLSPNPLLACNRSNAFALKVIAEKKPRVVVMARARNHEKTDFHEIALRLKALGVSKVVLVGPLPLWQTELYKIVTEKFWEQTPERSFEGLDSKVFETDRLLKSRYGADPALIYVSPIDLFCGSGGCLLYMNGDRRDGLVTYDYGHLLPHSSLYLSEHLLAPIVRP
jgi:peptidoglycan/LPS O-acetylase OafA/YrhL